jgi:hypothetical protein
VLITCCLAQHCTSAADTRCFAGKYIHAYDRARRTPVVGWLRPCNGTWWVTLSLDAELSC